MSVDQEPGSDQPAPHLTVPWATLVPRAAASPQLPRRRSGDESELTEQVTQARTAARTADGTASAPGGTGSWHRGHPHTQLHHGTKCSLSFLPKCFLNLLCCLTWQMSQIKA